MKFTAKYDREVDGRWICTLKGNGTTFAYGKTKAVAKSNALAIVLRDLADELEAAQRSAPRDITFRVVA